VGCWALAIKKSTGYQDFVKKKKKASRRVVALIWPAAQSPVPSSLSL
jgi:hypothetical protein